MTRYARGKGSKGSNNKQENTPTSWRLLKAKSSHRNASVEHSKEGSKRKQASVLLPETGNNELWFDFSATRKNVLCGKVRKLGSGIGSHSGKEHRGKLVVKSKGSSGSRVLVKEDIDGLGRKTAAVFIKGTFGAEASCNEKSILKTERKRFSPLARSKNNAGRKFKVHLSEEDLKDIRRKEKALKREKKKVCFCCRRWGHQLADCPEFKPIDTSDVSPPAGGLCYHCGSTEHNVNQCSKLGGNPLKFARCFVCGGDGHLARQCEDNPKGKYPKGGSCRFCGETSHLCSDCPKSVNKTTEPQNILSCSSGGPVDSLPEDMGKHGQRSVSPKKIIQF